MRPLLVPAIAVMICGCGGTSDDSSDGQVDSHCGPGGIFVQGHAGLPDGQDGATLFYLNGHPLNWMTTLGTEIDFENAVAQLVNIYRASLGLSTLAMDMGMIHCARGHSRHRYDHQIAGDPNFSHENPEGDDPWERMAANGVSFTGAGENLAGGFSTPQEAFAAWMESPGHKAILEHPCWTRTGVGYSNGFWTQLFAR